MAGCSAPALLLALQTEKGGFEMAVRVILEVKAKPGTGDEVVAFFRSILPETRAYEGCTRVETLQNSADADNVILLPVRQCRHRRRLHPFHPIKPQPSLEHRAGSNCAVGLAYSPCPTAWIACRALLLSISHDPNT